MELYDELFDNQENEDEKLQPILGMGAGNLFQMKTLVDINAHSLRDPYVESYDDGPTFSFGMNSYQDAFEVFYTKAEIEPGYQNKIRMSPVISSASETLVGVDVEKRACKFPRENKRSRIFQ